jgi:hypothetical protein
VIGAANITFDAMVDFGAVIKDQVYSRRIELTNRGSRPGTYSIQTGDIPAEVIHTTLEHTHAQHVGG